MLDQLQLLTTQRMELLIGRLLRHFEYHTGIGL